jgi:hypothetical protein
MINRPPARTGAGRRIFTGRTGNSIFKTQKMQPDYPAFNWHCIRFNPV